MKPSGRRLVLSVLAAESADGRFSGNNCDVLALTRRALRVTRIGDFQYCSKRFDDELIRMDAKHLALRGKA